MSRAVTQLYDACLAAVAMKTTQFIILQTIASAGPLPQWELGEILNVGVDTLTRRLGSLRREELVTMHKGEHKQERIYSLTPQGRKRLAEAEPHWQRAQQRLQATLGADRWESLLRTTAEITAAANRALETPMTNTARAAK